MTTLDTQTWLRGEVPGLGLTDEDIGLLRGVDCDILAPGMGYPGPRLNRINRVIISTRCILFSEVYLERTAKLSVLGLEQFGAWSNLGWVTNREVFSGAHE
jgi:hypothetical protein